MDEINLSVAEPDLNIHSIFSQETVVDSSCECQSSQETIDSSSEPPSPASSTVELPAVKEIVKPNEISFAENVKSNPLKVNRVIKRHIIDESDSSPNAKKSKVEISEDEKQGGFHDTVSPSNTTTQQLPSCVVLIDKLPKNLSPQFRKSAVHNTLPITHQIYPPKETSTQLLEGKLEEASVPKITTIDIAETSKKEATKIKQVFEAIPTVTAKLTKRATKVVGQHEFQSNKPDNSRIKSNATNINERKSKLKDTSNPVANGKSANLPSKNDKERNRVHDSLEKNDIPSKDIKTTEHVDIIKPSSPPTRKCPTKAPQWNPPGNNNLLKFYFIDQCISDFLQIILEIFEGKASGPTTPSKGSSPAIGLRLGLSRNRRANKPLHPDVKLKI